MPLRNFVDREIIGCAPDTPIEKVAEIMKDNDVGAVLVSSQGKPLGIVTDRDIVLRCIAEKKDCASTKAEQIMSRSVETVNATDGIYDVAKKMRDAGVRRIPIVNEQGQAIGLLAFEDVFALIAYEIGFLKEAIQPRRPTKIETQEETKAA